MLFFYRLKGKIGRKQIKANYNVYVWKTFYVNLYGQTVKDQDQIKCIYAILLTIIAVQCCVTCFLILRMNNERRKKKNQKT